MEKKKIRTLMVGGFPSIYNVIATKEDEKAKRKLYTLRLISAFGGFYFCFILFFLVNIFALS